MLTQKQIDSRTQSKRDRKRRRHLLYKRVVHVTRDYWGQPKDLYEVIYSAQLPPKS